jgi:biopolymer transport protein ExbD
MGSWRGDDGTERSINMTPLIDVSLVLVVMLLLATPLAFESSIGVNKDDATAQAAEVQDEQERIEIVVRSDDEVEVNTKRMPRSELSATLSPLLAKSIDRSVMIGCEDGVSHGAFVDVLDQAKLSGASGISVYER